MELRARLEEIAATLPQGAIGVSVHDYLSDESCDFNGERWFHAASTIKVAILAAVFDAIEAGKFTLESRVHVRNRFFSIADGTPYGVPAGRDADRDVHAEIGRTLRVHDLARRMIGTSSNLATNLLLDAVGLEHARAAIRRRGIDGIDLQRGVEDDRAFEAGRSNRVTARGLTSLLRAIYERRAFSDVSSAAMIEILFDQRFSGGIAPGLPAPVRSAARIAHKTGDISMASHDVGLVFLPARPPYVLSLLTEGGADADERSRVLAAASGAIYDAIAAPGETACR
jgi:beta-lactamase class A